MFKVIITLAVFAVALVAAQREVQCGPLTAFSDSETERTSNRLAAQSQIVLDLDDCCAQIAVDGRTGTVGRTENTITEDVGETGVRITQTAVCFI